MTKPVDPVRIAIATVQDNVLDCCNMLTIGPPSELKRDAVVNILISCSAILENARQQLAQINCNIQEQLDKV